MEIFRRDRRDFLTSSIVATAAGAWIGARPRRAAAQTPAPAQPPRIRFGVIGLNHGHIYGQVEAAIGGGGELVSFYAKEADLASAFAKRHPQAKLARSEREMLEDSSIQLIVSASIPNERAPLGIEVMRHGKDFMVDKPGMTTLEQLAEVRRVQAETKRIYSILYSERHENQATVRAGELVRAGAIGQVIQTVGLGPHRLNPGTRPAWFFERERYGGILCDIASHQFDQFLYFTASTQRRRSWRRRWATSITRSTRASRISATSCCAATAAPATSAWTGSRPTAWRRGATTRLTVLGTDGYIEVRKNIDIARAAGGNHLFLVDTKETRYIDCRQHGAAVRPAARGRCAESHRDVDAAGARVPGDGAGAARGEAGAAPHREIRRFRRQLLTNHREIRRSRRRFSKSQGGQEIREEDFRRIHGEIRNPGGASANHRAGSGRKTFDESQGDQEVQEALRQSQGGQEIPEATF